MSTFQLQIGLDTFPPLVQKQANGAPVPNGEHEDVVDDRPSKKTQYGFDEGLFNALPTHERKKMATTFLRDLTVVSRSADGLVYTGTSNVGRLLALLNAQASLKKPVQTSVDVHWFPTARYQ